LFFQDEARFGRIDSVSSCWVPPGGRAKVGCQVVREYTYVYMAVCPETGENFSLILPYANGQCMDIFLKEISKFFKKYRIVMAMDRAAWHSEEKTKKYKNIVPLFQPPYSPEVNPVESVWNYIRENGGFTCTAYKVRSKNATFDTLKDIELKLVENLKKMDKETIKSITLFRWIKDDV